MIEWINEWINYGWEWGLKLADYWPLGVLTTNPQCSISCGPQSNTLALNYLKIKIKLLSKNAKIISWLGGVIINNNNDNTDDDCG